jgi:DNA ligase (NAD+)
MLKSKKITVKIPKNKTPNFSKTKKKIELKNPQITDTTNTPLTMTSTMDRNRLNERFLELMETLAYIMRKRKDPMRAKAYNNAYESIQRIKENIVSPEQLKGKPAIGNAIYEKLVDYTNTGTLRILDESQELVSQKKAMNVFNDIYGVGEKKAEELISKGILTISDLKKAQADVLNDKQRIGLKYYDDILQRIPRSEINTYLSVFETHFPQSSENSMEIVGSYRRGADSSGDIDVILTSKNPAVFKDFVDALISKQIIVEVLSRGPTKCLVIAKIPGSQYARRVDFLFTSPDEYPFAVLYFTGSKEFNTAMRERALKMGFTLNEHGFSKMENKKKGDKVDAVFPNEKSIFEFLKMKYKLPEQRNEEPFVEELEKPKSNFKITRKIRKPETKNNHADLIENFKKIGVKTLEELSEKDLGAMLDFANKAFHEKGEPVMTDNEFDLMREFVADKFPNHSALNEVGAVVEKNKVKLPYEMWSMDKIKPDTNVLESWKQKYTGPYVISCKLDGVSGLYTTEGAQPRLYTRGDGKVGQDISHMIPYLQLPAIKDLVIRGEFIIAKSTFEGKYAAKFANPRNLVAGIVNQKSIDTSKYKDIQFVAYEVIRHPDYGEENIKPSDQMRALDSMNVETVKYQVLGHLDKNGLSDILQNWRDSYNYEIDGIIVADDRVYVRTKGNPKHAFAFKMVLSDQVAEAHVTDVIWAASKDGYLKPRVQINPVKLGGVTITYATGFNGAFIENNKIGVGAVIMLVRSGDVIPYIKSVTAPASAAKMPDVEYIWNDTHVDIMLKDKSQDSTVLEKNIAGFFKQLEVDGLAAGNVKKLMKAGYDSICKIVHITKDELLDVEGFKEKMAEKLYNGIQDKIATASVVQLAACSNVFGRGFSTKKMELIFENEPNILEDASSNEEKVVKLAKIKGLEKKTAEAFVSHIEEFKAFLKECRFPIRVMATPPPPSVDTSHPLSGKTIVMTGFRDKTLDAHLKSWGAKSGSGVNKNTFVLLVKSKDESSTKMEDAKKHGVKIMTKEEFETTYL